MTDRPTIAVCSHHLPELRQALRACGQDVGVVEFAPRCGLPPVTPEELAALIDTDGADALRVIGGACLRSETRDPDLPAALTAQHCLEHFVDPGVIASWVEQGAYLVSPGWVGAWEAHVADWGFDQPSARRFFGDGTDHVLLVDTGLDPMAWKHTQAFADYIGRPARAVRIGLERFEGAVARQLADLRTTPSARSNSLYAMAFAQMGRFAGVGTELEAVHRLFDMFEMLFAPGRLSWTPWIDGERGEVVVRTRPDHPPGHRLRLAGAEPVGPEPIILRIARDEHLLGVLEIDAFERPERREEYLNLALSLRGACALAIANSRAWTALEEARAQLAEQAGAYRILADSADAMLVLDARQTVLFANPAARLLLGARIGRRLARALEGAGKEVVDQQGRTRFIDCVLTPIEWEGRAAQLAAVRDVTERRAAEEAVLRGQKMTLLGQLAGSVAHDFNNVLQAIGGSLEIVQRSAGLEEPTRRRVDEALQAAERGAGIARRLLLFSRPSSRVERVVEVVTEIARMEPLLRQLVGDGIALRVRRTDEDLYVVAGDGQLEAVLLNLVTNARDAQQGRGQITIEVGRQGDELRLAVLDEGPGIPAETLEHIFEPFYTTKGRARGTGLGLPSVVAAVERMGGRLDVQTEVGAGSCFVVFLPLVDGADASESTVSMVTPADGSCRGNILVVDDEPAIRTALAAALAEAGHQVSSAPDGQAALRLLADPDFEVDLLLTDVSMPGIDGFELARQARADRPGLEVVFISGLGDVAFPGVGLDPGQFRLLPKPFRLAEALTCVDEALEAR